MLKPKLFQGDDNNYLITFAKSFDKNLIENNKTLPWLPGRATKVIGTHRSSK